MSDRETNSCTVLCGPSYKAVLTEYEDHGVSVRCIYSLSILLYGFPECANYFLLPFCQFVFCIRQSFLSPLTAYI